MTADHQPADEARSIEQIQDAKATLESLQGEVRAAQEKIADLKATLIYEVAGLTSLLSAIDIKVLDAILNESENKAVAVAKRANQ